MKNSHTIEFDQYIETERIQDNYFIERLNNDLVRIQNDFTSNSNSGSVLDPSVGQNIVYNSNSPLSLSSNSSSCSYSDDDPDDSDDYDNNVIGKNNKLHQFHNLTYQEIEDSLDKYYQDADTKYSSELDIMITYLKGQKNLYIQSKNTSQYKLNALLIPSLLITGAITIFAPFIQRYSWSGGFISGLNAITIMLISISNYLKLESAVLTFYHTANQYDKLETSLEFVSSKMLFTQDPVEKSRIVLEKIQEIEKKVVEIKEWNPLFVPEEVRALFPIICHINVFSFIKRMEVFKKNLVLKFKDVKNEIRYIMYQLRKEISHSDAANNQRKLARLTFLLEVKEKIKEEFIHYKTAYGYIDELFTKEIKNALAYNSNQYKLKKWLFSWFLSQQQKQQQQHEPTGNIIIDKYLHYISS